MQTHGTEPRLRGAEPATRRWSGKELVTAGVFAAVYVVLVNLFGIMGVAGPWGWLVGAGLGMFTLGPVLLVYLSKVRRFGALALIGTLMGLIMVASGHYWVTVLLAVGFGLLADLVAGQGRGRVGLRGALACGVFTLWYSGPLLPIFTNFEAFAAHIADSLGQDYAARWARVFSPTTVIVMLLTNCVLGMLGGLLGVRLLNRHFRRAGLA